MSVPVQTPSKEYIANGTTTAFPLEFNCDKAEYLIVTLNGEEAPIGSWTLANDTVTFNVAPLNGVVVNLERNTPFQRTTNYQLYDNSFRPSPVNKDFDLIWWKLQELGYRDQVIWLALVKEISDRIAGDEDLQNQINTIDEWLGNLQENVDQNTNDIEQLVNDLSKEIADRIQGDQILKDMFLSMIDEAINEGTINALAITHLDSLEALEGVTNVWDGRTIYVKDLGNYRYDALTTSWVKAYQDADNVKDGAENQKEINDKNIRIFESLSDLLDYTPRKNGQTVFVKSYHNDLNKGGGTFVYNSAKSSINDGVVCFNGWVRQIESNTYTPYMAGCVCDGATDDGTNLEKLMYWLEVNSASGEVVVDSYMFINTLVPYTGKLQYHLNEKIGIRLVDNVHLNIRPNVTIKFGNVFNNAQTSILSAMYRLDATDFYGSGQHKNIKIYGGGTLDFTQTGGMTTQYWGNRYAINMGSTLGFEVTGVTFKGGQFSNVIASAKWGDNHQIHHNKFIDTFADSLHSEDHSTIYMLSPNSDCYSNEFILTSLGGRAIACTCEMHNSNQSYYNNKIRGYWSAVYFTAMEAAWEHSAGDIIVNQHAYNNDAECSTRFCWFDGTANVKIKSFSAHDNTIRYVDFPSDVELATIGRTRGYRGTHFFDVVSATSSVADFVYGAEDAFKIYDNTQEFADQSNADFSSFLSFSAIFGKNLQVFNNTIAAKRLYSPNGAATINSNHKINGLVFKGNIIDASKISDQHTMYIIAYSLSNADIDVSLGRLYHNTTANPFFLTTLTDGANSTGNTVVIKCHALDVSKRSDVWYLPYATSTPYNSSNAFSVPFNCIFSSYVQGNNLVYATTTTKTEGASYGEILNTDWFPITAKQTFIPRFASRERRTGQAATLSILVQSYQDLSDLVGNKTIPIQLYKDM